MKSERLITVYDKETEGLTEEINIDYVEVDQLKKIFSPDEDDPLMYFVYEIKQEHTQSVNELLKENIVFDLKKYGYFIECFQLPSSEAG